MDSTNLSQEESDALKSSGDETKKTEDRPERKFKRFNSGQLKKQPKTGRNDICPCGSGIKYKRCCLIKRQEYFDKQVEIEKQVEELIKQEVKD